MSLKRIVLVVLVLLLAGGLVDRGARLLRLRREATRLDESLASARKQLERFEYVLRRHDEMTWRESEVRASETWIADVRAKRLSISAPLGDAQAPPSAWPDLAPLPPPSDRPWRWREDVALRRRRLELLRVAEARGRALEGVLDETEERVAAAETRLAALEIEIRDLRAGRVSARAFP